MAPVVAAVGREVEGAEPTAFKEIDRKAGIRRARRHQSRRLLVSQIQGLRISGCGIMEVQFKPNALFSMSWDVIVCVLSSIFMSFHRCH